MTRRSILSTPPYGGILFFYLPGAEIPEMTFLGGVLIPFLSSALLGKFSSDTIPKLFAKQWMRAAGSHLLGTQRWKQAPAQQSTGEGSGTQHGGH